MGLNDSPTVVFYALFALYVTDDALVGDTVVPNQVFRPTVTDTVAVGDSVPVLFVPFLSPVVAETLTLSEPVYITKTRDFLDRFTETHRLPYLVQGQGSHTLTVNQALDQIDALLGAQFPWIEVTAASETMLPQHGYVADNASQVNLTLPAFAEVGTVIEILGRGAGGWVIAQNEGQRIRIGHKATTLGSAGSLASNRQHSAVALRCITEDTEWEVLTCG